MGELQRGLAVALLDDEPDGAPLEPPGIDLEARAIAMRERIAGPTGVGEHRRVLFLRRERRDLVPGPEPGTHRPARGDHAADGLATVRGPHAKAVQGDLVEAFHRGPAGRRRGAIIAICGVPGYSRSTALLGIAGRAGNSGRLHLHAWRGESWRSRRTLRASCSWTTPASSATPAASSLPRSSGAWNPASRSCSGSPGTARAGGGRCTRW